MSFLQEITGSFSIPAAGNPTVEMVEAAYRHHGLPFRYCNLEVAPEGLADAVRGAAAMGFRGFNLSMPHKVTVIPLLDGLGKSAELIGAVNCVVRRDGRWIGENTDGQGFLESLRPVLDPSGRTIFLLGAGGAARAIAVELALAGARRIIVANRDSGRGRALVALLQEKTAASASYEPWAGRLRIPEEADVVINATCVGLHPRGGECPEIEMESLRPGQVVADVVMNPPLTAFLQGGQERGCLTIDGLGMLVNQGVIGIRHWTGIDVDPGVMRARLEEIFGV